MSEILELWCNMNGVYCVSVCVYNACACVCVYV